MLCPGALTLISFRYESPIWASKYTTLGYLVAIMSLLGFPIMPRAKFLQTMVLNIASLSRSFI